MDLVEKRDYIHSHLHQVSEPAINELYEKLHSFLDDSLMEESEGDIRDGTLTAHEVFKQEIESWRPTK